MLIAQDPQSPLTQIAIAYRWPIATGITLIVIALCFLYWYKVDVGHAIRARKVRLKRSGVPDMEVVVEPISNVPTGAMPPSQETSEDEGAQCNAEQAEESPENTADPFEDDWVMQLFQGNTEKAQLVFKRAQDKEPSAEERLRNEVLFAMWSVKFANDATALPRLQAMRKDVTYEPVLRTIEWALARAFEDLSEYARAIEHQRIAIKMTKDTDKLSWRFAELGQLLVKSNQPEQALQELLQGIRQLPDKDKVQALLQVAEIYQALSDPTLQVVFLELALSNGIPDGSILFKSAYAASVDGCPEASIVAYEALLTIDPTHGAGRNNLANGYEEIGCLTNAVQNYELAASNGEPWSMANLALRYLAGGFAKEAAELIAKSANSERKGDDLNPRIIYASNELRRIRESDKAKRDHAIEFGTKQRAFYRAQGNAIINPTAISNVFATSWVTIDEEFTLSRDPKTEELVGDGAIEGTERRIREKADFDEPKGIIPVILKKRANSSLLIPSPSDDNRKFGDGGVALIAYDQSTDLLWMKLSEKDDRFVISLRRKA